jgi:hypothetical protein
MDHTWKRRIMTRYNELITLFNKGKADKDWLKEAFALLDSGDLNPREEEALKERVRKIASKLEKEFSLS